MATTAAPAAAAATPTDPRAAAINNFRRKLLDHREQEAKVKTCMFSLLLASSCTSWQVCVVNQ
jgi:hypothetical protein